MHRGDQIRAEAEIEEAARRAASALRLLDEAQRLAEPHRSDRIRLARLDLSALQGCHRRAVAVLA